MARMPLRVATSQVDVVHPYASAGDGFEDAGAGEHLRGGLGAGADDQGVVRPDLGGQFIFFEADLDVKFILLP